MVLQDYTPQHMLATLRTRLLVMYAQVDIALEEAARSYEKGEAVRAIAVCDGDTAIDALENEIDELCLRLMARIKPVAGDLRFVVAALRMVVDLERIGDEAVTVAEQTVLMDEPASALDPIATRKVEESIVELKEGLTIIIVTHSMQQAARISDRTAFFYMGRLVESDSTDVIFTRPSQKETEDYITGRFG